MAPAQSKMCSHRATRSIGDAPRAVRMGILGDHISVSEGVLSTLRSPKSGHGSSAESDSDCGGAFTHCPPESQKAKENSTANSARLNNNSHSWQPRKAGIESPPRSPGVGLACYKDVENGTRMLDSFRPFRLDLNQDDDVFGHRSISNPGIMPVARMGGLDAGKSDRLTSAHNSAVADWTKLPKRADFPDQDSRYEKVVRRDFSQLVLSPTNSRHLRRVHRNKPQPIDAQRIYSASACIFIANLPENQDDRTLEVWVTKHFTQFGVVFAKIRRDQHGMPYAFVQFTEDSDAREACEKGRGAVILGRPIRTEMAKADVQYIVSLKMESDGPLQLDEVRSLMQQFGELKKCECVHEQMRETLRIPPSILVSYRLYDPHRNLSSAFEDDPKYRVEVFEFSKRQSPEIRMDSNERFFTQYDIDRRSVYIGGLKSTVTQSALNVAMQSVGEVIKVQVYRKENLDNFRSTCFAFVEFARHDTPDHAIEQFNGKQLLNSLVRVERKTTKHAARTFKSGSMGSRPVISDTPDWMKKRRDQSPHTPVSGASLSKSSEIAHSPVPMARSAQTNQQSQKIQAAPINQVTQLPQAESIVPGQMPMLPVVPHYSHFTYGTPQVSHSSGMAMTPFGYYTPYYSMPAPETYGMYPVPYASSAHATHYTPTPVVYEQSPYRYAEGLQPPPSHHFPDEG